MPGTKQAQEIVIFIHIPKTAGGTFNSIIEGLYPKEQRYRYHHGEEARLQFDSTPSAEKDAFQVIHGHLYFGIHEQLSRPYIYVTFLRDPIDRLISAYYFIRERSHHPVYEMAQKLSLCEFYEQGYGGKEQDNGQTRILSGKYDSDEACNPQMLEVAKKHLAEDIHLVGLTERFDESLLMIANRLKWRFPFYYEHNIAKKRPSKSEISSEVLSFLQKYNEYDLELYRYATSLFEQQLQQESKDFQKQVQQFQTLNGLYKFPYRLYLKLKALRA